MAQKKTQATPGHHLLRVRITNRVRDRLLALAEEESERTGTTVTISDLVRAACYNYLLVDDSLRRLESAPTVLEGGDVVRVYVNPMLA